MADDEKTLPGDVPEKYLETVRDFTFTEAQPLKEATFDKPIRIGGPPAAAGESWEAAKSKAANVRDFISANDPSQPLRATVLPPGFEVQPLRPELIGIAGEINAGKSTIAGMIPGAVVLEMADPIYAMLSAMLGIPEPVIRQRAMKNLPLPVIGKTVRELARTLGTEWGRDCVRSDLWILLTSARVAAAFRSGIQRIVIVGVRFENEADYIRSNGGRVWHVTEGPASDTPTKHTSDNGIAIKPEDAVLTNSGGLDELLARVRMLIEEPGRA
jgi:hypothetical protein